MTNSVIGYQNRLITGTLSADSDPAAAPKENAANWRLDDYWQPATATEHWLEVDLASALTCDYVALVSPDFDSFAGAVVAVFSGNTSNPGTTRLANTVITTPGPKLLRFTSASDRYWRVRFQTTATQTPKFQIVSLGTDIELERGLSPGFIPPALMSNNKPINSVSQTGLFIGRSMSQHPIDFQLKIDHLTAAWVRSAWPGLLAHIEQYPFFLLPEPDGYSDEAVLAWTRGNIAPPAYSSATLMKLALNLQGFIG